MGWTATMPTTSTRLTPPPPARLQPSIGTTTKLRSTSTLTARTTALPHDEQHHQRRHRQDRLLRTVKTDQSTTDKVIASDLLISNNVRGLTYTQNKNAQDGKKILTFTHAPAKLTINLVDNSGGTGALYTQAQLKAATAEIATQKTKADVIFVKTTDAAKDIKNTDVDATITPNKLATANATGNATSFEAICIPQDIATAPRLPPSK